jgi:hypothetical protein
MSRKQNAFCYCASLLCFACLYVHAQDVQLLPELDQNLKLNSAVRLDFQAQGDREAGESVQTTIGPDIEFYLKPLVRLKRITTFDLDDAKTRFLVADAGFRSIATPDAPNENRMILSTTSHFPLGAGFLIVDRNRADLDWKSGTFYWRYRNKLEIDRTISIHDYHFIPYISAEPYYLSEYSKWGTTALTVGCFFPVGQHVQFESYFEHDNNTYKKRNTQTENVGVTVHLYFSLEKTPDAK